MDVHWTVPYVLHGTEGRDRQWDLRCKQGVHWTVPYVLHGAEGRDRQWDLKCKQGTYGCPLDRPLRPTWYRGTG